MQKFSLNPPKLYSFDSFKRISIPTLSLFNQYLNCINEGIKFLLQQTKHKKLTIIGVGDGAEFILRYLSLVSLDFFNFLDKIILINGFFELEFNHYLSMSYYEDTLKKLLDPLRLNMLNKLRIIQLNTKKLNQAAHKFSQQQQFFKQKLLKNHVQIQSRFMWNVYCNLLEIELFQFNPFLQLFAQFLILDSNQKLSVKQIQYFFKYKQYPNLEPAKMHKQQFLLNCPQTRLNFSILHDQLSFSSRKCSKLKFENKQNDHSLLAVSSIKIRIYTDKYIQIQPYYNYTYQIYYLQNLTHLDHIYILNHYLQQITISILKPYIIGQTQINLNDIKKINTNTRVIHLPDIPLKICPEKNLLFPLSISKCFNSRSLLIIQQIKSSAFIFFDFIENMSQEFNAYKNLHRNMIIITLFGLYGYSENIYSVFILQIFLNCISFGRNGILFVFCETMFGLSVGLVIQTIFKIVKKFSDFISYMEDDRQIYTIFTPFIFLFLKVINFSLSFNQWHNILLILLLGSKKSNFLLGWLLFYLNFDFINSETIQLSRLSFMILCIMVIKYADQFESRIFKDLNMFFLLLLNLFYDQEVNIMQTIIQIYVLCLGITIVFCYRWEKGRKINRF